MFSLFCCYFSSNRKNYSENVNNGSLFDPMHEFCLLDTRYHIKWWYSELFFFFRNMTIFSHLHIWTQKTNDKITAEKILLTRFLLDTTFESQFFHFTFLILLVISTLFMFSSEIFCFSVWCTNVISFHF